MTDTNSPTTQTRFDATWIRYSRHLPKTDDLSLIILKGHLIIEEMLFALVVEHCVHPESISDARLSFIQLVRVAQALQKLPTSATWWVAVVLLNKIRNALVHKLEPSEVEKQVQSLYEVCRPPSTMDVGDWQEPTTIPRIAEFCVCCIMGQMSVLKELAIVLREHDLRNAAT
jgi:hypothetical protein